MCLRGLPTGVTVSRLEPPSFGVTAVMVVSSQYLVIKRQEIVKNCRLVQGAMAFEVWKGCLECLRYRAPTPVHYFFTIWRASSLFGELLAVVLPQRECSSWRHSIRGILAIHLRFRVDRSLRFLTRSSTRSTDSVPFRFHQAPLLSPRPAAP